MKNKIRLLFLSLLSLPNLAFAAKWEEDSMPYVEEFITVLFNTLGNQVVLAIIGLIMITSALTARQMGNWTPLIYGAIASALIVLGTSMNIMTDFASTLRELFAS